MDKRIAGLLGAAAALTAVTSAQATAPGQKTDLAPAANYRDLLDPIPNALARLKADDAQRTEAPAGETRVADHHHHHHHGVRRVIRHLLGHHHHHHHHRYRHHHHHHHD